MSGANKRKSRAAARLAAVQALFQHEAEATPIPQLLTEFHNHRLGATIEEVEYAEAEVEFFDDLVKNTVARHVEIDALIESKLSGDWKFERIDPTMAQILRAGGYELIARADVPTHVIIAEYCDIADAFHDAAGVRFINGVLDAMARQARPE